MSENISDKRYKAARRRWKAYNGSNATRRSTASRTKTARSNKHTKILAGYGPPCPRCGVPMQIREHTQITARHLAKPYFFRRWYRCINVQCETNLVMSEEFKVVNESYRASQEGNFLENLAGDPSCRSNPHDLSEEQHRDAATSQRRKGDDSQSFWLARAPDYDSLRRWMADRHLKLSAGRDLEREIQFALGSDHSRALICNVIDKVQTALDEIEAAAELARENLFDEYDRDAINTADLISARLAAAMPRLWSKYEKVVERERR